jgi:fucose 4-O-acetylase-like acetyltransferase
VVEKKTDCINRELITTSRISYIDMARGIAISLVVLGHVVYGNNPLCIWIYSFHIPLFFMISGILLAHKEEWTILSYTQIVRKKALHLLYPYITFSILCYVYRIVHKLVFHDSFSTVIYIDITATFYGFSTLWFLPTLFFAETLFIFIVKSKYRHIINVIVIALAVLVIRLVHNDDAFSQPMVFDPMYQMINILTRTLLATSFIWIGYLYYQCRNKMNGLTPAVLCIIGVGFFAVNGFIGRLNNLVDFHNSVINNPALYYLCAVSGSLSLITVVEYARFKSPPLEYFGRNSLIIMVTHVPFAVVSASEQFLIHTGHYNDSTTGWITVFIMVMLIETMIVFVMNKYLRYLVRIDLAPAKRIP